MRIRRAFPDVIIGALRQAKRDRHGYSALEFAVIAPLFVLLIGGAAELGNYGMEYVRVANAAKAGAHFGLQDQSTAADTVGIAQAVRDDAGDDAGTLTVDSDRYCRCPSATQNTQCSGECPDEEYIPMYLRVSVSNPRSAIFPFLDIPLMNNVTATTVVRVR